MPLAGFELFITNSTYKIYKTFLFEKTSLEECTKEFSQVITCRMIRNFKQLIYPNSFNSTLQTYNYFQKIHG